MPHIHATASALQIPHTHFLQKGWTCRINGDGLPEWIPPWWIDQDQRPNSTPEFDASTLNEATSDDGEHGTPPK